VPRPQTTPPQPTPFLPFEPLWDWPLRSYIVQMKRLSAAVARQRFSDLLDAAERGENVVIERRGVQFELVSRASAQGRRRRRSVIEWIDPAVESGQWSWELGSNGLAFVSPPDGK
jgi:antitoxin (DNA-binding transcriptional repressor) of toxin-antitoxin stability system